MSLPIYFPEPLPPAQVQALLARHFDEGGKSVHALVSKNTGEMLTWSTSKWAMHGKRNAQWSPEDWLVVKICAD